MIFNILVPVVLSCVMLSSRHDFPPVFMNPIDIKQTLAGSFGEPRGQNFHAGIDIKTNGQIGYKIYAIDDGFVSRIAVSPFGYGKALYIDHPSGYTSVYAHLESFTMQIADYVESKQYEQKKFAVNLHLKRGFMPVKKGDIIAISGNSGSSMGPHLHFEIRNTATQEALDPMNFNFTINDNIEPTFHNIYFYPVGKNSHVDSKTERVVKQIVRDKGVFKLVGNDTIYALNRIGFAVHVDDKVNGSNNICNITNLSVEVGLQKNYEFNISKLSFAEVKYVQAHIDYDLYKQQKQLVHKCFVEAGNRLSNYRNIVNNGYLDINGNDTLNVTITARDSYRNTSQLKFVICGLETLVEEINKQNFITRFYPNKSNTFDDSLLRITIPKTALYDTINFAYAKIDRNNPKKFPVYRFYNKNTPLHNPLEIEFKNITIPRELSDKAVLVDCSKKNYSLVDPSPIIVGSSIKGRVRDFTDITIAYDTIPPKITPLNIRNGENMTAKESIKLKISDNLSGIKTYECYIDNRWILFEYDAKNNMLEYKFDHHIATQSNHTLQVYITDNSGNKRKYEVAFVRN